MYSTISVPSLDTVSIQSHLRQIFITYLQQIFTLGENKPFVESLIVVVLKRHKKSTSN